MPSSRARPSRRATSQLLNRLLQHFRAELMSHHDPEKFPGLRFPHLHVLGNIGRKGVRLTDVAERAQLGLAACSELVNDLESLGYIERRPDPSDGRAKLIFPTERGSDLLYSAADAVAETDRRWRMHVGAERFDEVMSTLDELLTALDGDADARRLR